MLDRAESRKTTSEISPEPAALFDSVDLEKYSLRMSVREGDVGSLPTMLLTAYPPPEGVTESTSSVERPAGIVSAEQRQSTVIREAIARNLRSYLNGEQAGDGLRSRIRQGGAVEVTVNGEVFITTNDALRSNVQAALNDVLATENLPTEARNRAVALSNFINTGEADIRGRAVVNAPAATRQGRQTDSDAVREIVGASQRERLWSETAPALLSAPPQSSRQPREVLSGERSPRLPAAPVGAPEAVLGQGILNLGDHPLNGVEVVLVRQLRGERGQPVMMNESFRRFTAFTGEGSYYISSEHPNRVFKLLDPTAPQGSEQSRKLIAADVALISVEQHNEQSRASTTRAPAEIPPDNSTRGEVTYNAETGRGGSDAPARLTLRDVVTELERRAVELERSSDPNVAVEAKAHRQLAAELQRTLSAGRTVSNVHLHALREISEREGTGSRAGGRLKLAIDATFAILGVPVR